MGDRYSCEMSNTPGANSDHPAFEHMRLAVEVLATGHGQIRERLQAAERHFGLAFQGEMRTRAQEHLRLRIGAGLVEGSEENDATDLHADASNAEVAESIALLDEARAVEIAGDMLRLYELVAGLRSDDGYGLIP